MISIAIISILGVLAGSAYSGFVSKAQVAEGFSLFTAPKLDYEITYQNNGGVPPINNAENGMTANVDYGGRFLNALAVSGSGVLLAYERESNADIAGTLVVMVPHETVNQTLVWACQGGKIPTDDAGVNLPIAGTSAGFPLDPAGLTTTPSDILPAFCRP